MTNRQPDMLHHCGGLIERVVGDLEGICFHCGEVFEVPAVSIGCMIRLTRSMKDPYPVPTGTRGIVRGVVGEGTGTVQIWVDWLDCHRSLNLITGDFFVHIGWEGEYMIQEMELT